MTRTRTKKPLEHTYWIQGGGNHANDPRVPDNSRWRAVCDVCPWIGDWHDKHEGRTTANTEGRKHQETHRGAPGYDRCDECGYRVWPPGTALCDGCQSRAEFWRNRERHDEWWS